MKTPMTQAAAGGGGGGTTASNDPQQQREIAIFWDFENVHLPSWANPADASKAIVAAVSKYGRIVDRRLYFDTAAQPGSGGGNGGYHWSALDSSGFDLVNTPRRNQKETLDKKMIADVLTFAWDSAVRNDHCKPCVVLLTSDGDYAYTLSKLRDRGVMSVIMYSNSAVAAVLKAAADIPLSFEGDVLSTIHGNGNNNNNNNNNNNSYNSNNLKYRYSNPVLGGTFAVTENESATNDALALSKTVLQELSRTRSEYSADGWLLGSKLAVGFRNCFCKEGNASSLTKEAFKEKYRRARELAIQKGWLVRGHKHLVGPDLGSIVATSNDARAKNNPELFSKEDFLRVTVQGQRALDGNGSSVASTTNSKTKLFIKNIPGTTRITDLVRYLEDEHNVVVIRGHTLRGHPNTPFLFGRVEVSSELEAERLLGLSDASKLRLQGRLLQVSYDSSPKSKSPLDRKHVYERPTEMNKNRDDVFTLCKSLYKYNMQQGSEGRSDGWTDGGFMNTKAGSRTVLDNDKERFKKARTIAIAKNYFEAGRRVKLTEIIEVATATTANPARHTTELYLRLTEQGHRLAQQSSPPSGSNNMPQGVSSVFMRNLPVDTQVKEFVRFLESTHNWPIERATVEEPRPWSPSTNAHLEFSNVRDAVTILKLASCSDGLIYQGRPLAAVPDQRVPINPGIDPSRIYESNRIPAVVSTTVQSMDSSSLSTADIQQSEMQSEKSAETSQVACDEPSLFCRLIFEKCSGDDTYTQQWKHTANIAEEFQKLCKGTPEEAKDSYRRCRHHVISEGLAELGRRILTSERKEVTLVPNFTGGQGRPGPNLSLETYLRLTTKGVDMAEKAPDLEGQVLVTSTSSRNIFLSNLPNSTDIHDMVNCLESNHEISIRLACLDDVHAAKSATAHIELRDLQDYDKIAKAGKDQRLVYGGRALRVRVDKYSPEWTKCKPNALYENIVEESKEELISSKEEEISVSGANSEATAEADSFETTNLLFGDNLALLYAQGAPKVVDAIDTNVIIKHNINPLAESWGEENVACTPKSLEAIDSSMVSNTDDTSPLTEATTETKRASPNTVETTDTSIFDDNMEPLSERPVGDIPSSRKDATSPPSQEVPDLLWN